MFYHLKARYYTTVNLLYHEPRQWFIIGIDRKFDKNTQKTILKICLNDFQFWLKTFQNVLQCCLVVWTIAETLENCFNNFRHFVIYPNFSIFLFERATVKLKCNVSVKTIDGFLKYQYPVQSAFKSTIFIWNYKVWTKTASFWMPSIMKL